MDFQMIIDWVATQGIWCALFVWLFYQSRKEANERETKLMVIVEQQGDKLKDIANTLNYINERLDIVDKEIEEYRKGKVDSE